MNDSLVPGSVSTLADSVTDAVASYHRAQYFATANIPTLETSSHDIFDEESSIRREHTFDEIESDVEASNETHGDQDHHDMQWDDTESSDAPQTSATPELKFSRASPMIPARETSPLLQQIATKASSKNATTRRTRPTRRYTITPYNYQQSRKTPVRRKSSSKSLGQTPVQAITGQSTYGQTFFNSCAILLGIGMLSEPIAFAHAGWVAGTIMIILFGLLTCYTAKILARIILEDPTLHSYSDIGRKAFGSNGTSITTTLFCVELFAVSVILVTLCADSLHAVMPQWEANTYKVLSLAILVPTVFLPLHLLSYASVIGIFSTVMIIVVIFVDGFSKSDSPGSLWTPAPTSIGVGSWREVGIAAGLFMAGYSGHTVIPSLAKDMKEPEKFDHMINRAFAVATAIYTLIGFAGYMMFGKNVSEEVSTDLLSIPDYNPLLNHACLWMLVLSPLSKFALATRPVNRALELICGLTPRPWETILADCAKHPEYANQIHRHVRIRQVLLIIERSSLAILAVVVSILVPQFSIMMGFLGAFCAFVLCVVGPIAAKAKLEGKVGNMDAILMVMATIAAVWGTLAAFVGT